MSDKEQKFIEEISDDELEEVSGGRGGGEGISTGIGPSYSLDRTCPACGTDLWIRSSPLGGNKYYFVCKSCYTAGRPTQRVEEDMSKAHY